MARPRKEYKSEEIIGNNGIVFIKELEGYPINNNTTTERVAVVKCPRCGREFRTLLRKLTRKTKMVVQCQECSHADLVVRNTENGYKRFVDLTGETFGKLTVIKKLESNENGVNWLCKCKCGLTKVVTSHNLTSGHTLSCGCMKSKGETLISKILSENKVSFIREKIFEGCINPKTGGSLRFDFYLPDYGCCIEYDGEQHFRSGNGGWNTKEHFEETKCRDNIKDEFCKENNIKLVRIPYFDYNKITIDYLLDRIIN